MVAQHGEREAEQGDAPEGFEDAGRPVGHWGLGFRSGGISGRVFRARPWSYPCKGQGHQLKASKEPAG